MKSRYGSVMSSSTVEPLREGEDLETARRRAAAERRASEITRRNQEWANFDWASLWRMLDQRILETIAAQGVFTENQREVLATVVSDAHGEIDKTIGDLKGAYDAKLEALERRVRAPGTLPRVKVWKHGMVTYEGELTSFNGQLYQAKKDTGLEPGDPEAWVCVARAGKDAAEVTPRGEWSASVSYGVLSLVTYQGGSFLATRDNPGRPDDGESGWQAVAAKGEKGDPGPRGPRGNRGEADARVTIVAWSLDVENYRACPALNNGEVGAILDLRPLFAQFGRETGTA
jgi:hypothetical protein